jgi:hypothetical protein
LSAPYVGQGSAASAAGASGGCVTVGNGPAAVVEGVAGGRMLPHAASAPVAAITAMTAEHRRIKTW